MMRAKTAAGLLVALALPLGGCGGGGGSSRVSPTAYLKSVCTAVGSWAIDIQKRSGALNVATITDAAQGKTAVEGFMSAAVADTGRAVSQLKAAGAPNVPNGQQISSALVSSFSKIETALAQGQSQAAALPTDSPTSFRTAARALSLSVRSSLSGIATGLTGLKSPALVKAAKSTPACTPLGA